MAVNKFWAVVPAAGVGSRMQADRPKQYLELLGRTVIENTIDRLLTAGVFEKVVVAIAKEDGYWPSLGLDSNPLLIRANGGSERSDSVLSALKSLQDKAEPEDWVLVHDAARPCITHGDIHYLIEQLQTDDVGGILALPVHDTLKGNAAGRIEETLDRSRIWRALTPQMFRYGMLFDALQKAADASFAITDEASAIEWLGYSPALVEGRSDNLKITRPEDLALATFYLEQQQ